MQKGDYTHAEYCMGYDGTIELSETEEENDGEDGLYYNQISEENCDGWTNSVTLTPGEFQVIDSGNYEYSVTVFFHSDIAAGANHTPNLNYFALTETNYNDFVACELFIPIDVVDIYGKFGAADSNSSWSTSHPWGASFTDIYQIHTNTSTNYHSFSHNTIQHNPFWYDDTLDGFGGEDYDEQIYLVLDNWHCEEEKYDGTAIGDVYIYYEIGVQTNATGECEDCLVSTSGHLG
jgi:hypothetical protein